MALSEYPVRASIAVSDIARAVEFYEGRLGLRLLDTGPSAAIPDAARTYEGGGGSTLHVYQSPTAGTAEATVAVWFVDDLDGVVGELADAGVDLVRYDALEHDARGITPRAGGGRIAWFQDPDGNTFALESDR